MSLQPTLFHLGGENCVTGSSHLMQAAGLNILVDCGLSQGADFSTPMESWPVSPRRIDYLFLTHAHIDHIGRLPKLLKSGFSGEIICSHPTNELLLPMLTDAMGFGAFDDGEILELSKKIDELSWGFEYGQELSFARVFRLNWGGPDI